MFLSGSFSNSYKGLCTNKDADVIFQESHNEIQALKEPTQKDTSSFWKPVKN